MNNKVKPAVIGGVLLGLLSVIPFVNALNICCCLWAILGGMLASYLYIKNSPTPATPGDGAMLGALAGVIGAVISLILGIPISYAMGPTMRNLLLGLAESLDPQQAQLIRRQIELSASDSIVPVIINSLILAVLLFIFSIIGGLIGTALFEKRKGGSMPPPPPATGGPGAYVP
jgi:purine-cytosine permease-like protein